MVQMKRIYKYELSDKGRQEIELPWYSQILSVQMQNGTPCIWVLLNPDDKTYPQLFEIYGTGHEIKKSEFKHYIGSWQDGPTVWHLFKTYHS